MREYQSRKIPGYNHPDNTDGLTHNKTSFTCPERCINFTMKLLGQSGGITCQSHNSVNVAPSKADGFTDFFNFDARQSVFFRLNTIR